MPEEGGTTLGLGAVSWATGTLTVPRGRWSADVARLDECGAGRRVVRRLAWCGWTGEPVSSTGTLFRRIAARCTAS